MDAQQPSDRAQFTCPDCGSPEFRVARDPEPDLLDCMLGIASGDHLVLQCAAGDFQASADEVLRSLRP